MNGTIKVTGGIPLKGTVTPIPNKNAILAAIPAAIISDKTITYKNVPKTSDVDKLLTILKGIGAKIDDSDYDNLKINCKSLQSYKIDSDLGGKFRASILFAGPLLARFGKAEIPLPGGCVLGFRSIAAHVDVFKKAGIKIEMKGDVAVFTAPKKLEKEYDIWQLETSVTATENLAMYAAGSPATYTLHNAASEPHVTQVLELISKMGADVSGVGSNTFSITGTKKLKNEAEFIPQPDFVDIAGYIVAAAITKGKITIKGGNVKGVIENLINRFSLFNVDIKIKGDDVVVDGSSELKIDLNNAGVPLASPDLPKIKPEPWPGLQVDILPVFATLACKTPGRILLQNWMYETGLDFIRELNKMGANIFMSDPQRVIITGPITFKGGEIVAPGIIQACKAIFLAALADNAQTTIHGINVLSRRYPDIINTYKALGAKIEIINENK